jgi:hypothetical protein
MGRRSASRRNRGRNEQEFEDLDESELGPEFRKLDGTLDKRRAVPMMLRRQH